MARFKTPDCKKLSSEVYGTPFYLKKTGEKCLAILIEFELWDSSILYMFDSSQKMIFKEIITEECSSITTIKDEKLGTDIILVGGNGNVWSYTQK